MLSENPSFGQRLQSHALREHRQDVADKRVARPVWGPAEIDSKEGLTCTNHDYLF